MSRPTIVDVARAAGVSRATAARVMSGATNVDPTMVASVEREAARLGYEANHAARILRGGRAGAIGLVIAIDELDSLNGTFFTSVLKGAANALSQAEVQPVLLPADHERRDRIPRFLRSGAVDGAIIILQHEITHLVESIMDSRVPIAWVGRPAVPLASSAIVVDSDNYGGGRLAARALIESGRRRIALIAGPADMHSARERTSGWRDELTAAGIAPGPVAYGDFTVPTGEAAMARIFAEDPEIDGVFAASDLMASGALRVLAAHGRRVPEDVGVVGFDDVLVATATTPPLTTVRQPLEDMGFTAAETLVAVTRGVSVTRELTLPTTLVRRRSL